MYILKDFRGVINKLYRLATFCFQREKSNQHACVASVLLFYIFHSTNFLKVQLFLQPSFDKLHRNLKVYTFMFVD